MTYDSIVLWNDKRASRKCSWMCKMEFCRIIMKNCSILMKFSWEFQGDVKRNRTENLIRIKSLDTRVNVFDFKVIEV